MDSTIDHFAFSDQLPRADLPSHRTATLTLPVRRALAEAALVCTLFWTALTLVGSWISMLVGKVIATWWMLIDVSGSIRLERPLEALPIDLLSIAASHRALDPGVLFGIAVACVAVFAATFAMRRAWQQPIAFAVRGICAMQLLVLGMFCASGDGFGLGVIEHTRALYVASIAFVFAIPALLAPTYYVLGLPFLEKIAATALIIGYFVFALPFKLIAHAVLIQVFSPAIVPVLFLLGGPLLDVVIFLALYATAVARARRLVPGATAEAT